MTLPPIGDPIAEPVFEVLDGGLQATIQDLGRPDHVHEGVPRSGAADPLALAVANALVGNPAGEAAIEVTVGGLRLRARRATRIGLAGADLGATVAGDRARVLEPGAAHELDLGDIVAFDGRPSNGLGCRAYVAVPSGIAVPEVLGSRSTSLVGGFGGFDGRALRAGDLLLAPAPAPSPAGTAAARLPVDLALPSPAQRIRVLAAPADDERQRAALDELLGRAWIVSGDSDRRGLRLDPAGGELGGSRGTTTVADRPSEAVIPGTIQVTPSGRPLVLMPDAGTTGGYPIAAVVIDADLPLLGQLAPWDEVRFRLVDLATARSAALERRSLLASIADRLGGGG